MPRALVIDDSKTALLHVRQALESAGFEVHTLTEPREFLDSLRDFSPDVVLVDVVMPTTDGARLLGAARGSGALGGALVVLHSSDSPEVLSRLTTTFEADGWIQKSSDGARLAQSVKQLLASSRHKSAVGAKAALAGGAQGFPSTNLPEIDDDHYHFFQELQELRTAIAENRGADEVLKTARFLEAYVEYHFAHESEIAQKAEFPNWATHAQDHDHLRRSVEQLKERILSGADPAALALFLEVRLSSWLKSHIATMDVEMARHLTSQGDGPPKK